MLKTHAMHAAQTDSSADTTALLESDDQPGPNGSVDLPATLDTTRSPGPSAPSSLSSSRLLNTTNVLELAMYTFGDLSTAQAWMQAPQAHLRGHPAQMCLHPGGENSVLQLLYAIASGTEP